MGTRPNLVEDLRGFAARLSEGIGPVDHVILFGSQATGEAHEDSDVDLIVVSSAFEGQTAVRRAARVRRFWHLPDAVDFLCYTPAEFDRLAGQVSIVRIALDQGREITASA